MSTKMSVYENVTVQFNRAADLMQLDPDVRKILEKPVNEVTVNFPVKMEGGTSKSLRAIAYSTTTCWGRSRAGCAITRGWILTRCGRWRPG